MKKEILEAPDISKEDFGILLNKQMNNRATRSEKVQIEKYMYKHNFGIDKIDFHFLDCFYQKTDVLFNLLGLIDDKNLEGSDKIGTKIDYDIQKKKEKNRIVREIINMLGFDNISDSKRIARKQFQSNIEVVKKLSYLFTNPKFCLSLFGLNKRNIISVKSFLGFFNSLLSDYGIQIKSIIKSKWSDGKKINEISYKINFINNIHEFIDFLIKKGRSIIYPSDFNFDSKKWITHIYEYPKSNYSFRD